ncbi:MAG: CvpA family protein [Firmicutes bacterium]|nr:CvpA family protein [Bacillota bacterium]
MNWLDLLLFTVIIYFAVTGWRKGLIRQLFDVAGTIASYFVALNYGSDFILWLENYIPFSRILSQWLPHLTTQGVSLADVVVRLLGFILLYSVVIFAFRLAGNFAHHLFSLPVLGLLNGLIGMLLGTVKGVLLAMIIVGMMTLISTPFFTQPLADSFFAATVLSILPVIYEQMMNLILADLL